MEFKFTLVLNAGRSGSTFLYKLLSQNFGDDCYVCHEDIPVQISKPKVYNRQFEKHEIDALKEDAKLMTYIAKWQDELKQRHVIETGWTSYHLAPLLKDIFKEKFQIIILHRDPISFAFSRANMGNYHENTFYTSHHEVSPFDVNSIVPEYQNKWNNMNHFEKCMFWWYTVYKEAFEFKSKNPEVPCLILKSKELFNFSRFDEVLTFLNLNSAKLINKEVSKNELAQFMRETFPLNNEWSNYHVHKEILKFANDLDYVFNENDIVKLSEKYKLPRGLMPLIRYKTKYWKIKSKSRSFFKI
jgi:hypothetical protein